MHLSIDTHDQLCVMENVGPEVSFCNVQPEVPFSKEEPMVDGYSIARLDIVLWGNVPDL